MSQIDKGEKDVDYILNFSFNQVSYQQFSVDTKYKISLKNILLPVVTFTITRKQNT
jgi:hypothetical protein